ncbi:MAG: GAF domain-containing protein [Anaerolineales bacterium]|nr:GAF domain-containing protein [Chloroflexota bacterium]MBL6981405.1 GAF domain-containing protein [Anaerolineales bacterium]
MPAKKKSNDWLNKSLPLVLTLIALGLLILAPFWAYQWFQQPFMGLFLEPNNVISQVNGQNWPAKDAGAEDYAQLIAINNIPVKNVNSIWEALSQASGQIIATIQPQNTGTYQITFIPRQFKLLELVTWFGIPYSIGIGFWLIGVWAYFLSKGKQPSRAFLSFTSAATIITAGYFDMNTSQYFVLGWAIALPITGGALAQLALVFPRKMVFVDRTPVLRFIPWAFSALFLIPVVKEILQPANPWSYINTWLLSYAIISLAILLFLGSLIFRIVRSDSPMVRQQSRIIVFGAALAFGPILFTFLLPSAIGLLVQLQAIIAFPALIIFPLSVAYALVRYRLLDVDRIMGRTLTYALTITIVVAFFYLLLTFLSQLIPSGIRPDDPLQVALYLLFLVLALTPLRNYIQRGIDRIFYRNLADYRHALTRLSQELTISPEMDHTLQMLEQEIQGALAPERVLIYLYDDSDAVFRPQSIEDDSEIVIPAESPLLDSLRRGRGGIWFPPGRTLPIELAGQAATLEEMGCRVFIPLHYEGKMIGFLALGPRRSGDPYSSDDLNFLEAVAGQSSLALENVRLFANLQETLNQTLEMKNLMDDIFASMSSGVITTDEERKITLFNQAATRILGLPLEQVVGRTLGETLPEFGPHFLLMAASTLRDGSAIEGEEFNPVLGQRGPVFLRLSSTPLRDAQLNTKGATIVIDDLTKQRSLEAEQERIRQTFGRVVAPRVRDRLLEDPSNLRLDGIRQPLTVVFADIHNFTPLSERIKPEALFQILNSYLSVAAMAVLEEEGTLDKFMGDAVLAFWNAPDEQPDHVLRAARAALAMDAAIRKVRAEVTQAHQLFFSIGISTGEAMVGNVGTPDLFNYTVIGDIVNYASRLESTAAPGQILLSKESYVAIAEHVTVKELPPIQVKGKSTSAVVYELLGLK